MDSTTVFLFCIFGLYLLALLISGLLAFFYQVKHKPFAELNKSFQDEVYTTLKKYDFEKVLVPIKDLFETNDGEDIYLCEQLELDISTKTKKEIKQSFIDLKNNQYGVLINNYKLFPKNEKEFFENQKIYLSNKRIVLDCKKEFKVIRLSELYIAQFAILNHANIFYKILLLETREERIKILIKDLEIGLLIFRFLNKG